jgi:hypothetical protein
MLDEHHHYFALGVGKLSADPFLRFLDGIFIQKGKALTVKEAKFLAYWTVYHVIGTNAGGVAGPVQMAVLSATTDGIVAAELSDNDKQEPKSAIQGAHNALRAWRDSVSGETASTGDAPPTLQT